MFPKVTNLNRIYQWKFNKICHDSNMELILDGNSGHDAHL